MKYEETLRGTVFYNCAIGEEANWAKYWFAEYEQFSGIVPENTHNCYVGMTAGESANYAWEQYQAYSERMV